MHQWDELGNVAAQWWVLLQVALLLTRLGLDHPAALLMGAFRANENPTYMLLGDQDRLQAGIDTVTARMGRRTAHATMAEGAMLGYDDVAALARRAISSARDRATGVPT